MRMISQRMRMKVMKIIYQCSLPVLKKSMHISKYVYIQIPSSRFLWWQNEWRCFVLRLLSAIRAHFAIRRVCFARRGIGSSSVCKSRSPRLISGGLRPPYPRCVFGLFFWLTRKMRWLPFQAKSERRKAKIFRKRDAFFIFTFHPPPFTFQLR